MRGFSVGVRALAATSVVMAIAGEARADPELRVQVSQRGGFLLIGKSLGYDCKNPVPLGVTLGTCGMNALEDSGIDVYWRADSPMPGQVEGNSGITAAQARTAAERLADTLIGAAIAWGFSYVLPAWEKGQLPGLVRHLRHTLGRYGHHVLQWQEGASPMAERTQTRREVYDAIWLLAQALQRTAREPGYAGSWSPQLEALLIRSHRLIGLLAVVRIVIIHRREDLHTPTAMAAVQAGREGLRASLADDTSAGQLDGDVASMPANDTQDSGSIQSLPAPHGDPTPWLAHRLTQIGQEARAWAQAAHNIEHRR